MSLDYQLGVRAGVTAVIVWSVFEATAGFVAVWTEVLLVGSLIVPVWLGVGIVVRLLGRELGGLDPLRRDSG